MRKLPVLLSLCLAVGSSPPAAAQVTDAERAAARELFREGDELQRAGHFTEALDKFQRAQQVFSAPTNMLRIAECDAALGRLVESSEAYHALVRTPLPPGSPQAFQAALDQARGELAQVEPRVPKLVVKVDPPAAPGPRLEIDGQAVPAALIGEPFPLDPGPHRVRVTASGYTSTEQQVVLKERETTTLPVPLKPIAGVTYSTAGPPVLPAPPLAVPVPPPADSASTASAPPAPPPLLEGTPERLKRRSTTSFLFGLHLGLELPAGNIPISSGSNVRVDTLTSDGLAFALDTGLRFARQFYVGLTLEHAALGIQSSFDHVAPNGVASSPTASTTALGAVLGLIVSPDRPSLFLEAGVEGRWYSLGYTDNTGMKQSETFSTVDLLLGIGAWIPAGRSVRLLPELTAGLGTFSPPSSAGATSSQSDPGHAFLMIGIAGFFNADL